MSQDPAALTRRRFLALSGAALGAVVAPRPAASAPEARAAATRFLSRPDLRPPSITIGRRAAGRRAGSVLLSPFDITGKAPATKQVGPLIVDDNGEPVWFKPLNGVSAMGLRVQKYRGKPVLTWYEGQVLGPYGGTFVVVDTSYRELIRVKAGHGYHADLHEILLTTRGTALITIYNQVQADLSAIGGSPTAQVVEGIIQELELPSGKVLFEWHSLGHVGADESFTPQVTPQGNVDYFHLNSIGVDLDGHLLVSARNTSTVYKLNRKTGQILWRLGGKKSDFQIDPDAAFSFQHDVRRQTDGTLTLFDNAASLPPTADTGSATSRPMRLALDMTAMRARLVEVLPAPQPRLAWAMGNLQELPGGGSLVGWGTAGAFTEFSADGDVLLDGTFDDGSVSYRAFRSPWKALPAGRPSVAVRRGEGGTATVYASWNGATEVERWRVLAGPATDRLRTVATAGRSGFETAVTVGVPSGRLPVAALDVHGRELGRSLAVKV